MGIYISFFYVVLFVTIAVIDWRRKVIPNAIIFIAIPISLTLTTFYPELNYNRLWSALIGGAVGFFPMLILASVTSGTGGGDVKLAGLVGVVTAFPGVLMVLGIAFLTGGLVAIFVKKKDKSAVIPFGPFLCAGALIVLFWGNDIINLYKGI